MKFAGQLENVAPHRKSHMKLPAAPYYDHATHWKCSSIPNLIQGGGWGGSDAGSGAFKKPWLLYRY